jgi:hypothetical protein
LVVLIDDRIQVGSDAARAKENENYLKQLLHPGLVLDALADRDPGGGIGKARLILPPIRSSRAERRMSATKFGSPA